MSGHINSRARAMASFSIEGRGLETFHTPVCPTVLMKPNSVAGFSPRDLVLLLLTPTESQTVKKLIENLS